MPIVKVWNDNQYEHREMFKNEERVIPAGGFIEMDYIDAKDFQGQYIPMKMLGPNNPDPRSFKKIRVEEPTEPIVKEDPNVFHATGKSLGSMAEVMAFAKAYAAMNPDLVVKDDGAAAQSGPSQAELLERIAALEALVRQQQQPQVRQKPKTTTTAKVVTA